MSTLPAKICPSLLVLVIFPWGTTIVAINLFIAFPATEFWFELWIHNAELFPSLHNVWVFIYHSGDFAYVF